MTQYPVNDSFSRVSWNDPLLEYLLLLIAEDKDRCWTAGTAVLVADRLALSAKHIPMEFQQLLRKSNINFNFDWMPPEKQPAKKEFPVALEALQFLPDGETMLRWHVEHWTDLGGDDCDLAILNLAAHPACPQARRYFLSYAKCLRLQMFPPAVGQDVFVYGWPDEPGTEFGELPFRALTDFCAYKAEGKVDAIGATALQEGRNFPRKIYTNCETYSGMSGGLVLTTKPLVGTAVCGIHSMGPKNGDKSSTESLLWPILAQEVKVPFWFSPERHQLPVLTLARRGVFNIPGSRFFSIDESDIDYGTYCAHPELIQRGTIGDLPDWIEDVETNLQSSPKSKSSEKLFPIRFALTRLIQEYRPSLRWTPPPTIRKMNIADLPNCAVTESLSFPQIEQSGEHLFKKALADSLVAEFDERHLTIHSNDVFIVGENSKVVGHALVAKEGDSQHLYSLAVHPDYRGRRVALALMRNLVQRAVFTTLDVKKSNFEAVHFYLLFGFTVVDSQMSHMVRMSYTPTNIVLRTSR